MAVLRLVPRTGGDGPSGGADAAKTRSEPPQASPDKLLREGWLSSRKPTSLDIAYLAGVSQATVSRALRDSKLAPVPKRDPPSDLRSRKLRRIEAAILSIVSIQFRDRMVRLMSQK